MEENEVKVESENVVETPEIPDKTPLESKKMSPKEKKATWIIGSIGVLLVVAFTTVMIVGAINDNERANHPIEYYFDWNQDLAGFYNASDKYAGAGTFEYEIRTDSADREYAHINNVTAITNSTTFVLPSTVKIDDKNYSVYSIGDNGASAIKAKGEKLKAIYAQSLYKEIGSYSFSNLPSLTKVSFRSVKEGKQEIGDHAFYNNPLLTDVTLADNLTALGDSAFEDCSSLTQINLSGSLTKIGKAVFKGCKMNYINFNGNKTDWEKIVKEDGWAEGISDCYIQLLKETKASPYIYIE